jgi:acetyl-CoA/propionyl-CoA carboxylase biotin carboxyl carrier protein
MGAGHRQAEDGSEVAVGEVIAVMEAMKMETRPGWLRHLAEAGKPIGFGTPLARIEPA